ncbi:hypothetical protein TWF481_002777 [Arthrobotrys musiformis]|uniref:Ndc10 domain-containing protein n=1 Tax=Arthrobotrys musiformis TaxID=47236 RepID=A0AAV9VXC3_9PEZI
MPPKRSTRRSRKAPKAEPYNAAERLAILAGHRAPPSCHAKATRNFIEKVAASWDRYCTSISMSPKTALSLSCDDWRYFKGYLEWFVVNSTVKSYATVEVQWKYLRLVYTERTQTQVAKKVGDEIRSYLYNNLRVEQELTLLGRGKPLAKATDLFVLLNYHWALDTSILRHERYRIQLPLILMIMAFTASRPGALVESNCRRGTNESLKYKDVSLQILPCDDERKIIIIMELTSWIMKGRGRKQEPVTFMLHERDDCLAFDPIILFLALAFADNAFKSQDIKQPADLFKLRVPSHLECLHIQWREDILEAPVFREAKSTGSEISETEALSYGVLQALMKNLGENAGYEEPLKPYNLRRAAANAIDSVATLSQRTQALGHTGGSTFDRWYKSRRVNVDIQSAFLGTPSRKDLLEAIGKMGLRRHPQAPKSLTPDEKEKAIQKNEVLENLQMDAAELRSRLIRDHKNLKSAKDADSITYKEYQTLQSDIRAEKTACQRDALSMKRKDFFDNMNEIEIANQLRYSHHSPVLDHNPEVQLPKMAFRERSDIAALLFGNIRLIDRTAKWSDQPRATPEIRISILEKLISLCQSSEGILNFVEPQTTRTFEFGNLPEPGSEMAENENCQAKLELEIPIICPSFQRLFCLGDTRLAERARFRGWSRSDSLRRHVLTSMPQRGSIALTLHVLAKDSSHKRSLNIMPQ